MKPAHRFTLSRLSIGDVDQPTSGVINAVITSFRLVELRENSAADSLGEQLDPECVPKIPERCQKNRSKQGGTAPARDTEAHGRSARPDGRQIVFDRLRENSDIVLIDLVR